MTPITPERAEEVIRLGYPISVRVAEVLLAGVEEAKKQHNLNDLEAAGLQSSVLLRFTGAMIRSSAAANRRPEIALINDFAGDLKRLSRAMRKTPMNDNGGQG